MGSFASIEDKRNMAGQKNHFMILIQTTRKNEWHIEVPLSSDRKKILDTKTASVNPPPIYPPYDVAVAASESSCAMENARMKCSCLPGGLLDGLRNGEFALRVEVYRGF